MSISIHEFGSADDGDEIVRVASRHDPVITRAEFRGLSQHSGPVLTAERYRARFDGTAVGYLELRLRINRMIDFRAVDSGVHRQLSGRSRS